MKKNYNYAFLFYDIKEKRVQKVFKICKKYLVHYQYSVFRGTITPSNLIKLQNEIQKIIDNKEDFVSIVMMSGDYVFEEKTFGAAPFDNEEFFL